MKTERQIIKETIAELRRKGFLKESDDFIKGEPVNSIDSLKKGGDYYLLDLRLAKWLSNLRYKGKLFVFENNKTGEKKTYSEEELTEMADNNEIAKQEYK